MILPKGFSPVAYFCSEFAIDSELPTYAGGLGVLAGDYMNAGALTHSPTIGIGILYKGKNFVQHVTTDGKEEKRDSEFDHDTSFLRPTTVAGKQLTITLPSPQGEAIVKAYHLRLSDESIIFFLSTDVDGNPDMWKQDMDTLYSGDVDSQLRQQILLGVGGMKLLDKLNIKPKLFHMNEGRPIFLIWELTRQIMNSKKLDFYEAWEEAKKQIVYTNHTLVAAGNPSYHIDAVKYWAAPFTQELEVSDPYELVKAGHINDADFSITRFALNISSVHSAVSKVHGKYCRKTYPEYKWVPITNGVHLHRWQDSEMRNPNISDRELWNQHLLKKRELAETVKKRTGIEYDPNRLVISWARRLAEYKQPKAIFKDIEKLNSIVTNADKPVQILYAGNSHAADPNSKSLIEEVIQIFSNNLNGHAIFVPNYNISLANHMTSGSDVWLNTPKGNLEACGTSGMKAISNGVINCTVLDGWTYEVDWEGAGWTIDPENVAEDFYSLLENEITNMYFENREDDLPIEWIARMRKSIEISKKFSAERMLEEYKKKLYSV
jgi:starch phosphorylase